MNELPSTPFPIVIIKESPKYRGQDSRTFRAYTADNKPLNVTVTTTGNPQYGALRCAAKAFSLHTSAVLEEVETRISLTAIADGFYLAKLTK
jgi:hypothetical protein